MCKKICLGLGLGLGLFTGQQKKSRQDAPNFDFPTFVLNCYAGCRLLRSPFKAAPHVKFPPPGYSNNNLCLQPASELHSSESILYYFCRLHFRGSEPVCAGFFECSFSSALTTFSSLLWTSERRTAVSCSNGKRSWTRRESM